MEDTTTFHFPSPEPKKEEVLPTTKEALSIEKQPSIEKQLTAKDTDKFVTKHLSDQPSKQEVEDPARLQQAHVTPDIETPKTTQASSTVLGTGSAMPTVPPSPRGQKTPFERELATQLLPKDQPLKQEEGAAPGIATPTATQATAPVLSPEAVAAPPATVPLKPKLQKNTFETVTRYMPPKLLEQVMRDSFGRDEKINQLVTDLKNNKWQDIISHYNKGEEIDYLAKDALIAFRDGSISMEQFSTLTTCWSTLKDFPNATLKVQSLFNEDGTPNQSAKLALKQGFYNPTRNDRFFTGNEGDADTLINNFFTHMESRPASEKVFFYIDTAEPTRVFVYTQEEQNALSIQDNLDAIGFRAFNEFSRTDPQESYHRMFPAFSMVQGCIDACGGQENMIAASPVIGFSSEKDIFDNIANRGRDILLVFPGVYYTVDPKTGDTQTVYEDAPGVYYTVDPETRNTQTIAGEIQTTRYPPTADGHSAKCSADFVRHDIYHEILIAHVPDPCRQNAGRIASLARSLEEEFLLKTKDLSSSESRAFLSRKLKEGLKSEDPIGAHYMHALFSVMIDMEFTFFIPDTRKRIENYFENHFQHRLTLEELFLLQLQASIHGIAPSSDSIQKYPSEKLKADLNTFEKENRPVFEKLAKTICSEEFFKKNSINPKMLNEIKKFVDNEFLVEPVPANASIIDHVLLLTQ